MAQKYDMICVFNPSTAEEKIEAALAKLGKKITAAGGVIENTNKMGLRKVNTRMRDFKNIKDGYFVELTFEAPPGVPDELTASLKVNEDVMRFILTRAIPKIAPEEEKPKDQAVEVNPEMLIGKPE